MSDQVTSPTDPSQPVIRRLRIGTITPANLPRRLAAAVGGLPDRSVAIVDLSGPRTVSLEAARALGRAMHEAARRGVACAVAASEVDVRLPLVLAEVDRVAPIRCSVPDAARTLRRTCAA